jgi:lactoylglutathione lyase
MIVKGTFNHFNIDVTNLENSLAFYDKALGLKEKYRKTADDGSFTLAYLTDGTTGFLLELTWLIDHPQAYELGENESHLCIHVPAEEYDEIRAFHKENDWVCYENESMGIYFIHDPDDYWIEVVPSE